MTSERWRTDAGAAEVATLVVPPSGQRVRAFEVDVRFVVRAPLDDTVLARHAMSVDINGVREWSRRIDTANPGQTDSLDYHCRREIGVGETLRVRAVTQVTGALRQQLSIEAEEGEH